MSSSTTTGESDWCPACGEDRPDHPTMCTVCGESLCPRPATTPTANSSSSNAPSDAAAGGPAIHEEVDDVRSMLEAFRRQAADQQRAEAGAGGQELDDDALRNMVENLGQMEARLRALTAAAAESAVEGNSDEWERPPPEALNPAAAASSSRPTSKECIDRIPRIKVDGRSAVLHDVIVECILPPTVPSKSDGRSSPPLLRRPPPLRFHGMVAEFGPAPPYGANGRLVAVDPPTCKGAAENGGLSSASKDGLKSGGVAYVERGGNVTFAQKAILAQRAGASAVVVGNNVGIWPYVMRDSKGEADRNGLTIPVVMVKRSDGRRMRLALAENSGATVQCRVEAQPAGEGEGGGCVVCRDPFAPGDTVMRLPFCAHCFHERCALMWLEKHNTCPYCRRELPTDDEEYERERRRRGTTHARNDAGGQPELHNSQWESLFG